MLHKFIIIALAFGPAFAATGAIESLKSKLQMTDGTYKIFRGDEDLCNVGVDFVLIGDAKSAGVRVGQKFIWGNLTAPKFSESAGPGCKTETVNTLEKNHIKSVSNLKCKDPKKNLLLTLELLAEKDQIRVNYERLESDKKNNQNFYCVYKRNTP